MRHIKFGSRYFRSIGRDLDYVANGLDLVALKFHRCSYHTRIVIAQRVNYIHAEVA
jgi:hypothetical protein